MNLASKVQNFFRLSDLQKKALKHLGIDTISDLLYYFPTRYTDISDITHIARTGDGERATLLGKIQNLKTKKSFRGGVPMAEGTMTDFSGSIKVLWFNQPYLAKMIKNDSIVKLTGLVSENEKYGKSMSNPEIEKLDFLPIDISDSLFEKNDLKINNFGYPIYKETKGITSKWFYHAILKIIKSDEFNNMTEYLPNEILEKYSLPDIKKALVWIHSPHKKEHADIARKRFAFEEIFLIQLAKIKDKIIFSKEKTYTIENTQKLVSEFLERIPFPLTDSQKSAIATISKDLEGDHPMARLLEGDVGSGKTLVAAASAYAVVHNRPLKSIIYKIGSADMNAVRGASEAYDQGVSIYSEGINERSNEEMRHASASEKQSFGNLQVAYMAPTEILATQQFESFIEYVRHTGLSVALITGSGCRKFPSKVASNTKGWTEISKSQLSKWVANGEIPIVVGTHALIQKSVKFKHLALAIVDEQHRFGTKQRQALARKESDNKIHAPHFLSMTATPIPRTLALTVYGDLDLSIIDSMPPGRKPVITEIVSPNDREKMYEKIKKELENGRQCYIICPRISDPDPDQEIKLNLKSVKSESERLKNEIFKEYKIDILHSKMKKDEKEEVMKSFLKNEFDILVATSVVEVGVNVPNATVIVIEGAERFGLSQLHQLRGRVIRGTHQPYCYLVPDIKTSSGKSTAGQAKTAERLKAIVNAKNGFELSEIDLNLRGAGEMSGFKQWGVSDLAMDAIKNIKLVEYAREEAKNILARDIDLKNFPTLKQKVEQKNVMLHFE